MVRHDVNHEIHASSVQCLRECQEVIGRAVVWIYIVSSEVCEQNPSINRSITLHILLPVPVVGCAVASVLRELFCHWSNPNSSKAHSLDII